MAIIVACHYVLADCESAAVRVAQAIHAGLLPPIAKDAAELTALRFLHPLPAIGRYLPYAVFLGVAEPRAKSLQIGDWAAQIAKHFNNTQNH